MSTSKRKRSASVSATSASATAVSTSKKAASVKRPNTSPPKSVEAPPVKRQKVKATSKQPSPTKSVEKTNKSAPKRSKSASSSKKKKEDKEDSHRCTKVGTQRIHTAATKLSDAKKWSKAQSEWLFDGMARCLTKTGVMCACGHKCRDVCILYNSTTQSTLHVSVNCLSAFFGESDTRVAQSHAAFQSLTNIKHDPVRGRASDALRNYAHQFKILDEAGSKMYAGVGHREHKSLSKAQQKWISDMNQTVVTAMSEMPRRCPTCHTLVFARTSKSHNVYFYCCEAFVDVELRQT